MDENNLESKVRAIVKETLADMLGLNTSLNKQRQWYSAKEAIAHLELDNEEDLHRPRRDGRFVEGKHYRQSNNPDAGVPRFQYHVGNVRKWLNSPASKR